MPAKPANKARLKVLVVDDDAVVLEVTRNWLEHAGYNVTTRVQAIGTAEWVTRERPDFVLLDVHMPGVSGSEIAQMIHRNRDADSIAIVFYSVMADEALDDLARCSGAVGGIKKTNSGRLFIAEFERLIARHRANSRSSDKLRSAKSRMDSP